MKTTFPLLATVLCILGIFVMKTYAGGTVQKVSFFSASLHSNRRMQVYFPEGYNPGDTLRYPVIYFLHGAGHNDTDYTYLFPILDSLIANHSIKPVIVVKPDGSVGPWDGSFYTNSALYGLFEDYIVYDVVSYVDSSYLTLRSRDKRCIIGHSMGGYGSMKLALKHPGIYHGAAAHSGPIDLNVWRNMCPPVKSENGSIPPFVYNPNAGATTRYVYTCAGAFSPNLSNSPYPVDFPMDSLGRLIDSTFNKWLVHNPARIASTLPPGSNLALYFDCGTQDELGCYAFNTGFRDSLHLLGLKYTWASFVGSHWNHLYDRLPISLHFLDSVMNVSTTIRRVPQDYAKIQQAISACVAGDTVLVDHGLYYENIRYLGKKIVVASRYILDKDTSHISKTIIDGSRPSHTDSASVIAFDVGTDSSSELCGLTIQGGKGNKHYDPSTGWTVFVGGGVDIFGNGGKIVHNQIINNEINSTYALGAAISAWDQKSTNADSKYIIIENNYVGRNSLTGTECYGGGVAVTMSGRIHSNIIRDNKSTALLQAAGGGVTIWGNSKISLANNIIARNHSSFFAGAILIFQWSVGTPAVTMINNTICYNTADQGTEGISRNVSVKMLNNIIWDPGDGTEIDAIIWNPGDGTGTDAMNVTRCAKNLIRGGWFGKDIVDAAPLFADTVLFRLSPLSPAIARGSMLERLDSENAIPPVFDYLGNLRPNPNGANPDLGAIESEYNQPVAVGAQPIYINRDISYGGNARNTHIFLPRAYYDAGKKFPLMIFLHGSYAGPSSAPGLGFYLIADTMNFIIASPKSLLNGWDDVTENGFIETLMDTLTKYYRVDTNNIFVGGHSNGGYMSYRFGLNSRKGIKGIASVAGLLQSKDGGARPASSISLISFHSTDDAVIPYSGVGGYLSAEQSVFKWLSYQSCSTQLDTVNLSDPFPQNSNTVQRLSSRCSPVVFYKITGGSHAWPGPYFTHVQLRPTIPDINATLEIMRFFQSQVLTPVDKDKSDPIPQTFYLSQNYPNPFNPNTSIVYSIPQQSQVTVKIFDLLGREAAELVNERKDAGRYSVHWNASAMPSGVYFYTLNAGQFRETKRMSLIK